MEKMREAFQAFARRVAETSYILEAGNDDDFFLAFKVKRDEYLREEIITFITELLDIVKRFNK